MAANIDNPFVPGNLDGSGIAFVHDPGAPLTNLHATGGPDLQATLTALRATLVDKQVQIQGMGGEGERITKNLVMIKTRIHSLLNVINNLFERLQTLETTLQTSFNATLQNIAQDIAVIRQGGMNQIIGEIAAINTELNEIRDQTIRRPDGQVYNAPGEHGYLVDPPFNALPATDAQGRNVGAANPAIAGANANEPPGFYGGGKKKKGGYTYPKMRSRSRLRSHPRIDHKFNTIKPKKHTRRHRKHNKSSKKHRKH